MADAEKDPERLLRVGAIVKKLKEATEGHTVADAQQAFANAIALMCLSHPDSEVTLLVTIEMLSEIYRGMRQHVRDGQVLTAKVPN